MQPDTIIPDLSNPQSWNRYSYVTNRTVNFSDPTGHTMTVGEGGSLLDEDHSCDTHPEACGGELDDDLSNDSDSDGNPYDTDNDGVPDLPNPYIILFPLATAARYPCDQENTYVECLYRRQPLVIDGDLMIDSDDFERMLIAIFFDLKNRDTTPSNTPEKISLMRDQYLYDTPFWNGYGLYPGKACINSRCYERQEINYVAQGMWSADSGQTLGEGLRTVYNWKHFAYNQAPSYGTAYWFKVGYNFYTQMDDHYEQLTGISK